MTELRVILETQITGKQKRRIVTIEQDMVVMIAELNEFIYRQEVADLIENINQMAKSQKLSLATIGQLQNSLLN
ncbi:MAG: hypothetical protein WBA93_27465 [Microcoleaceae cyanobacterium]